MSAADQGLQLGRAEAELRGDRMPLGDERPQVDSGLSGPGVQRGPLASDASPPIRRLDDLRAPLREMRQHRRGHAPDLPHSLAGRAPLHPKVGGEAGTKLRLVEIAARLGLLKDRRGVQRDVAAVEALGEVGDHSVRVQLRVQRAARSVAKEATDEPGPDVLSVPARLARAHDAGIAFHVTQGGHHRLIVRLADRPGNVPTAEMEQQRHGLRRGERHIEPPDRLVAHGSAQHALRPRVDSLHHHPPELFGVDLTLQPQPRRALAEPLARRLPLAGVVVIATAGDRSRVVPRRAPVRVRPTNLPHVNIASEVPLDQPTTALPDSRARANRRPWRSPRRRVSRADLPGALSVPKPPGQSGYPRASL